jgi:hypothetical protein
MHRCGGAFYLPESPPEFSVASANSFAEGFIPIVSTISTPSTTALEREVEDHDIWTNAFILLGERARHTLPCADPRSRPDGS